MAKIPRINMNNRTTTFTEVPQKYSQLAGRALTSTFISDEVDPASIRWDPITKSFSHRASLPVRSLPHQDAFPPEVNLRSQVG
jgi:hypothetical protein